MVSLQDSCCLDISYDPNNNSLIFGEDVEPASSKRVMLRNLIPALLNKSLHYPEVVYEEHIQVFNSSDFEARNSGISFDVINIPAGLLGVEFIKSHIYYSPPDANGKEKYSCVVEVHLGVLTVILQKNKPRDEFEIHTIVEEGVIIKLRRGEKLAIPRGYFYNFINTEEQPVVFVRIHKGTDVVDYTMLKRERGLAYYCIRKNARQEIVLNPVYRMVPKIKQRKSVQFSGEISIDPAASLYTQLVHETEKFLNLFV